MSRSAVLVGRTTSDVVYNVLSLIIMALTGLLVGWRAREGFVDMSVVVGEATVVKAAPRTGGGASLTQLAALPQR